MDRPPPQRKLRYADAARRAAARTTPPSPAKSSSSQRTNLTRLCSLFRIVAESGAATLVGTFPADEEEDVASTLDVASGVVWAVRPACKLPCAI